MPGPDTPDSRLDTILILREWLSSWALSSLVSAEAPCRRSAAGGAIVGESCLGGGALCGRSLLRLRLRLRLPEGLCMRGWLKATRPRDIELADAEDGRERAGVSRHGRAGSSRRLALALPSSRRSHARRVSPKPLADVIRRRSGSSQSSPMAVPRSTAAHKYCMAGSSWLATE
jgi:hypothetical protein